MSSTPSSCFSLADGLLVLLMAVAAFLLGCQELSDGDVWWHVRSGQWIWSHRGVPVLDPFTFASADRPWIDLHWVFQLMLAGAYALGKVSGMILLASAGWACLILIGLTSASASGRCGRSCLVGYLRWWS